MPLRCGALPAELLKQVADDTRVLPARTGQDPSAEHPSAEHPSAEHPVAADPDAVVPAATLEHQQSCPHCRAMIAELRDLWAPVGTITGRAVSAPPSLARRVMERVTALAEHNWHAVVEDNPGVTRIAAWVVAIVARRAAASVLGVGTVAGRVNPADATITDIQAMIHPPVMPRAQQALAEGIGFAGRRVVVQIEITAGEDVGSLVVLAQQVRRTVISHVSALAGLLVVEVDVHVSGIGEPEP